MRRKAALLQPFTAPRKPAQRQTLVAGRAIHEQRHSHQLQAGGSTWPDRAGQQLAGHRPAVPTVLPGTTVTKTISSAACPKGDCTHESELTDVPAAKGRPSWVGGMLVI